MENQSILYPIFNEIPNFEFPKPHLFAYSRIPKRWVGCYSKFISILFKIFDTGEFPLASYYNSRKNDCYSTADNWFILQRRQEERKPRGVSTILNLIWLSGARQSSPRNQNESFFSGSKAANDSRDQNPPPSLKLNPIPDVRPAAK